MRARSLALLALAAAGVAAIAAPAGADAFLKYERSTQGYELMGQTVPAQTVVSTTWIGKDAVRIEDGEKGAAVLDFKAGFIYLLDDAAKTFTKLPLAGQGSAMEAAMKEMKAAAEDEEEAAAMEEMMKGMAGAMGGIEATVTPSAETRSIEGLRCARYDLKMKLPMGVTRSAIWASGDLKIDPALFQRASNAFLAGFPGFEALMKEMAEIEGVPVLTESTTEVMGVSIGSTEKLVEHAERAAPAGAYAVPAGYAEKPLFDGMEGDED